MILANIAEILVGYQSRARIASIPGGTHKLILGRDFVAKGILDMDTLLTFTPDRVPDRGIIESGDILFQARGREHYAHCVENLQSNILASSTFYSIRVDQGIVVPQYLAWWINQLPAQRYLTEASQFASISLVTKSVLSSLEVEVPSIKTQKLICKTNMLVQKEAMFRNKIAERRIQLADALCMHHIHQQGMNR